MNATFLPRFAESSAPRVVVTMMSPGEVASLIDTHAAPLLLYARQFCDAAEDVVQEAFVKLVAAPRRPDEVVGWLYRVVRNGAIDAARMSRRRKTRECAAAKPVRWFVEDEVAGLDAAVAVAALERLPQEQREAIVARLWGGLGFEQIAAVAGCSASTAFRRYAAGIEALRQLLGEPCPDHSKTA